MNEAEQDKLLLDYLGGGPLDAGQVAELNGLLREHPELGKRLAELGLQECLLDEFAEVERGGGIDGGNVPVLKRRRVRNILLPVLVGVIVLVGAFYLTFKMRSSHDVSPQVTRCAGEVVRVWKGRMRAVAVDEVLGAGTTLRTGDGAAVTLRYPDGTSLAVARKTTLQVTARGGGKQIVLFAGSLAMALKQQAESAPMVLTTLALEGLAESADLTLAHGPGGTVLAVADGVVHVTDPATGDRMAVEAGEYVVVRDGECAKKELPADGDLSGVLQEALELGD